MISVKIICIGRLKDKFFEDASAEYMKRLKLFCSLEIIEISAAVLPDKASDSLIFAALEKEAEAIIKKIPYGSRVFPLCIEGKPISSEGLAMEFDKAATQSPGGIVFIIGGSHGLAERVKAMGHMRISMSKMTFPHRLARVMLLEQIYRAFSINAGAKYHK